MRKFELKAQRNCETLFFDQSPVTVGRSLAATVILRNPLISREHCDITWEDKNWVVHDKSSSGTFINGKLVGKNASRKLCHGDILGLVDSAEAQSIAWVFTCREEEDVIQPEKKAESPLSEESIDLSRLDCQSQAITDISHERNNLESQRNEKLRNLQRMELEYQQKEEQFNKKLKNIVDRQTIHPEKKAKMESNENEWRKEKTAITEQWEKEKKQLVDEISSNKSAEQDLKHELNRLQTSLDAMKEDYAKQIKGLKKEIENANQSKLHAVEATVASNQLKETLEQQLRKHEEENKKLLERLEQAKKEVAEATVAAVKKDDQIEKQMELELQCVICSELFIYPMTLSCMHTFCRYCLGQWTKNHNTCPSCRAVISSEAKRSLVTDNILALVVSNWSEELRTQRQQLVTERNELEAQPPAPTPRRGRRSTRAGRGRGRGANRGNPIRVAATSWFQAFSPSAPPLVDLVNTSPHPPRATIQIPILGDSTQPRSDSDEVEVSSSQSDISDTNISSISSSSGSSERERERASSISSNSAISERERASSISSNSVISEREWTSSIRSNSAISERERASLISSNSAISERERTSSISSNSAISERERTSSVSSNSEPERESAISSSDRSEGEDNDQGVNSSYREPLPARRSGNCFRCGERHRPRQ